MKQSCVLQAWLKEVFHGSDIVRRYTFRIRDTRGNCALLVRANHLLAFRFASLWVKSALFEKRDCFECQPPHKIAV